jgi:hypothetical protein
MAKVNYDDQPKITDTVVFDLETTDSSGTQSNVYKINTVTIYYVERGYTAENLNTYTKTVGGKIYTQYFKDAEPVAIFGDEITPAWLSTDTSNSFLTKVDYDDDGNPLVGVYRLEWTPDFAREGDYILCYQWTPIIAADTITKNVDFYLYTDTTATTVIPSHYTDPQKYTTLLDRYTPEMFKILLGDSDLTPTVLNNLNLSVAQGFSTIEDLANQIVDLLDANAVNEALLPYLGNLFGLRLKGTDTTLWRRQIKRAVPLFKKKGTLDGLKEALANADIEFKKFTQLWQVVSPWTWTESFKITQDEEEQSDPITFNLRKIALLPVDNTNFKLAVRFSGASTYTDLSLDYVSFDNSSGETVMTWVGDNLSISPIALNEDDIVKITYKFKTVTNQTVEDYIRSLPLADQRDEAIITIPYKNWNVKVVSEDDPMFDVIIPTKHPFSYPVVYGKIRTEFPYSENLYNMEEYNGSTRDSNDPCDIDKTFMDECSGSLSSKFTIDVEIEDLSAERLEEAEDIIKDFSPFHSVVHSINYTGSKNEFVPSPSEEIEILGTHSFQENVVSTQMDFNRLIEEGSTDSSELKRNMLASSSATAHTGTGTNLAIVMFSPGVQFNTLGVDDSADTYLEVLSGTDSGEYKVSVSQRFTLDIVQGSPDTITWPLDTSGFPYRLSNKMFSGTVSIYQNNEFIFSDTDDDVEFIDYGIKDDYRVVITSGVYAGTYEIDTVYPDNTFSILSFPTTSTVSGFSYELRTSSNALRYTGSTGKVITKFRGRVEFDIDAESMGIRAGDYVKYGSTQYKVLGIETYAYIEDYTSGDVVGAASIVVYRRLLEDQIGYLAVRGMNLNGTVPTVSTTAETNQFKENYLILIGTSYYQIESIDGSNMVLNGPLLSWGLTGTSVSYSIVQFTKTASVTTQSGHVFDRIDRRGNDSIVLETETGMSMYFHAAMLNGINKGEPVDMVGQQEHIWFDIEYKE